MVDLVYCLTSLLLFDISLSYYYINLRSSKIFCLFPEDIYISLGISVSLSTAFEVFCGEFLEAYLTWNVIISQLPSCLCCFLNCFFIKTGLSASIVDGLEWSRSFWQHVLLTFSLNSNMILNYKYLIYWLNWITHHFSYFFIFLYICIYNKKVVYLCVTPH